MVNLIKAFKANVRWHWNSFLWVWGLTDLNPMQQEILRDAANDI